MWDLTEECIPNDHSRQLHAEYYGQRAIRDAPPGQAVLALGLGTGESMDFFGHGLGFECLPEAHERERTDAGLCTYQGVKPTVCDDRFDLIESPRMFEHVRHPEDLSSKVARVLRPGGAWLRPVEVRPGIGAMALIRGQYLGRPDEPGAGWIARRSNMRSTSALGEPNGGLHS
jgi:hypothetical protein